MPRDTGPPTGALSSSGAGYVSLVGVARGHGGSLQAFQKARVLYSQVRRCRRAQRSRRDKARSCSYRRGDRCQHSSRSGDRLTYPCRRRPVVAPCHIKSFQYQKGFRKASFIFRTHLFSFPLALSLICLVQFQFSRFCTILMVGATASGESTVRFWQASCLTVLSCSLASCVSRRLDRRLSCA